MGLRIIYGKAGTGKSTYCFNEIKNKINENEKSTLLHQNNFHIQQKKGYLKH